MPGKSRLDPSTIEDKNESCTRTQDQLDRERVLHSAGSADASMRGASAIGPRFPKESDRVSKPDHSHVKIVNHCATIESGLGSLKSRP